MMRRNLFIGITNDKLKECFESYKRVQCKNEHGIEFFHELAFEYENIVGEKAAIAICQADMFNEIARRFFKIYDLIRDKDFCELFSIKVEDGDLK